MFDSHGFFTLYFDEAIIVFVAEGSWNEQASNICIIEIKKIIDGFDGKSFGIVVDSTNLEGVTPEGYNVWLKAIDEWNKRKHIATTRVDDPESTIYQAFLSGFDEFFNETQQFRYSSSIEDGISWLNSIGLEGFAEGIGSKTAITNKPLG
ncbi:MAG: hypothetical protein D6B28_09165 [Gammaproteobacteria bacterium]|nr:MAG: hypothetical protein D6B28_09165 [Gammaproteobacteria bacterium]